MSCTPFPESVRQLCFHAITSLFLVPHYCSLFSVTPDASLRSTQTHTSEKQMALDFDVDDGPTLQDLVQAGRRDILKGRTMEQCWSELADRHAFFKDIAKEGRLRGETLGVVLAAVEGLSRAIRRVEVLPIATSTRVTDGAASAPTSSSQPAPTQPLPPASSSSGIATDEADATAHEDLVNAEVLVHVADAYVGLYSATPVPTRLQWLTSLKAACGVRSGMPAAAAVVADAEETNVAAAATAASPVGRYLGKLRCTVQEVSCGISGSGEGGGADDEAGAEDGSFAEEELRELLRCCMAAGRRAARHASLTKTEARTVREMVKALQDFVGNATLEW